MKTNTVLDLIRGLWEFSYIRYLKAACHFRKKTIVADLFTSVCIDIAINGRIVHLAPLQTTSTDGPFHVNLSLYIMDQFLLFVLEVCYTINAPSYTTHFTLHQYRFRVCAVWSSPTNVCKGLRRQLGHIIHIPTYTMTIIESFIFFCFKFHSYHSFQRAQR